MGEVAETARALDAVTHVQKPQGRRASTLYSRLLRVMLSIVVPLSLATMACTAWMHYRMARGAASDIEHLISDGIAGKARVLVANHALALRSLVLDNAFGDVNSLILQGVRGDEDLVYGLFLSSSDGPWAYISPTSTGESPAEMERWKELGIAKGKEQAAGFVERRGHLFGQEILEYAAPVRDGKDLLGTVRYGFSTARMSAELAEARARSKDSRTNTLLLLAALTATNVVVGVVLIWRASKRISQPLGALTRVANDIAGGNRDVRAKVESADELAVLADAFNRMLDANQDAFERLRETTERALEASRLKSEFLANMSHEIRTPMNGVMGMAKLMLGMPLDGKLRRYVETIDVSATALLTTIKDVLDFSKMEAGKYVLQEVRFAPGLIVRDVAELLAPRAQEKGLELAYRVAPEVPPWILGDPDRFRQILNNLLGNAVKFTDSGDVFVELRMDDPQTLRLEVADTGVGIAEKDLELIFDAFSQVDGSVVRRQGGTGLGLAIARRLTTMMGGNLGVESKLGKGSRFWFTVPVVADELAEGASPAQLGFPAGKRALVVESNRRWCEVILEQMRRWGVDCDVSSSGSEAVQRLASLAAEGGRLDAFVIGKASDSFEVARLIEAVRAHAPLRNVPLILLHQLGKSASLGELEREVAAQLPKPLRMSDLYNSLQDAFGGGRRTFEEPVASEETTARDRGRVLVVDDNEINQYVAVEQLEAAGFSADVANNGAEAVEMLEARRYAVVLMDCQMPVVDGYTATRIIREREKATKRHQVIIALTAHAMIGERDRVLAAGMDDYISKPLRSDALTRLLSRYAKSSGRITLPKTENVAPTVAALDPRIRRSLALIEACLREMPKQMANIDQALAASDAAALGRAAHKLKGGALAAGADALAVSAETLQQASEHGDLERAGTVVAMLHSNLAELEAALSAELHAASISRRG
ncbi:MAG TPA: ATP-binding protein [Polyangiaceae bacterium]|nr:ATP-binding protein [Polyangiaceae bacterium]